MRKRVLSLCMVLALCFVSLLIPVTALEIADIEPENISEIVDTTEVVVGDADWPTIGEDECVLENSEETVDNDDAEGNAELLAGSVTSYSQLNSRWGSYNYRYSGQGDAGNTIANSGCGLLSLTNAVYYLNGNFIEPTYLADFSADNGYHVSGGTRFALYEAFCGAKGDSYGISYGGTIRGIDNLRANLQKGYVGICSCKSGAGGHIMAIVDYNASEGTYLLLDSAPSSSRGTYSKGYAWKTWSDLSNIGVYSEFYIIQPSGTHVHLVVKKGSRNNCVRELQEMLNKLIDTGKLSGSKLGVDGDFGNATDTKLREYQGKAGLTVDGVCGAATWTALERDVRNFDSKSTFDLNWVIDGEENWLSQPYVTVDIYVNDVLVVDDCADYSGEWPVGASYRIEDIKVSPLCKYEGPDLSKGGDITGTIGANTTYVFLKLSLPSKSTFDLNWVIDGEENWLSQPYVTVDIYVNDVLVVDDCADYSGEWPVGASYRIEDIKVSPLCKYEGPDLSKGGDITGTIGANTTYVFLKLSALPLPPPSGEWMSVNKESVVTGEEITFTYGATGATSYCIGIDRDGSRILTQEVPASGFTTSFSDPGQYSAYVSCYNASGFVDSNRVSFTVNIPKFHLDVNGYLDGAEVGGLLDYGTVDVHINGSRLADGDDVSDYYAEWPAGTTYEIRDIKPKSGYSYNGVYAGARTGSIGSGTAVVALNFSKIDTANLPKAAKTATFNGHIYSLYTEPVTWYAAKTLCEVMGGHLVTITSEEENNFVLSLRGADWIWIGATDLAEEKKWEWITGEPFVFDKWASGEPNDSVGNDEGSENYAHQIYDDGVWNDTVGCDKCAFVCEIERTPVSVENGIYRISSALDGRSLEVAGAGMEQGANIQTWENLGVDSQKFTVAKDGDYYTIVALHSGMAMDVEGAVASSCVNVSQCPLNGNDAQKWMFEDAGDGYVYIHSALGFYLDVCGAEAKNGANIWTYQFNGGSAQKFRLERIQNCYLDVNGYLDGASAGGLEGYGTVDVYVNGSRVADDVADYCEELPFGTSYEIKDIKPKDGYSYNGFREGTRVGSIESGAVNLVLDFYKIDAGYRPELTATGVLDGHTYSYYSEAMTWYTAKLLCENMGGHLVTITSEEENQFVLSLRGDNRVWLGATDATPSEKWEWITGEPFAYDRWATEEPNNDKGNDEGDENYAEQAYGDGAWNDAAGCTIRGFVCEIDSAAQSTRIALENKSAHKGATVELPVTIENNPGIAGATLTISYDKSALTLNNITKGALFEKGSYNANSETGVVQWYHTENVTDDGVLFALQFTVNENAQNGSYNIAVGLRDGIPANLSDADSNIVNAQFISGALEITAGIRGDVTGDGVIAINDVVKLARAVAGSLTLTEAEIALADVTGDGVIAINDVVKLARYVAGNLASLQSADHASLSGGESAVIEVATVSGKPGETVRVPVSIISNPGIAGAQLDVSSDNGLILKNVIKGDILSGENFTPDVSAGRIQWYYSEGNVTNTGILFTLEFEVSSEAQNGDAYAVTVNVKDRITANLSDYNANPVNAEFKPGKIQISETADHAVINTVSRNGNTITANVVCADSNASVFCGAYNNSGKMISIRSAQVASDSNYDFRFEGQPFDYAKVFIVDSGFRPLCEGKRT